MKFNFKDKVVLITGSASGIGKIMMRKALEKGAKEIVMLDYNLVGINQAKEDFAYFGKTIHTYEVDLSQQEQVLAVIEKIKFDIPLIDVVINNAGVIVGKNYVDHTVKDINWTMAINTIAVMLITNAFLPDMVKRNHGVVCNIASMAGLTSTPKMAAYVASKWAVVGFSETIHLEMKQAKSKVIINCVMPFYINTGMFDGVKSRIVPIPRGPIPMLAAPPETPIFSNATTLQPASEASTEAASPAGPVPIITTSACKFFIIALLIPKSIHMFE